MPVYVYRCEACGTEVEKRQSFHDAPLTECELCHGRLQKVLQPTPIVFKGSGFYATDHRSPSGMIGNGSGNKEENGKEGNGKAESKAAEQSSSSATSKDSGSKKSATATTD